MNDQSIWISSDPLILASNSAIRADLLKKAGFNFRVHASKIDERRVEQDLSLHSLGFHERAKALARIKAESVSVSEPRSWVIGADQILEFDHKIFHKAKTRAEVEKNLQAFAGHTHYLHSAVAIIKDQVQVYSAVESATLRMRALSDSDIKNYCNLAGEAILESVGSYQYEGLGRHLFDKIEGREDVIFGLPLNPIITFFRSVGCLKF